MLTRGR